MGAIREMNEQKIIEAAIESFGEGNGTLRDIAARAGMPKANIHYYFETIEQLYYRALDYAKENTTNAGRAMRVIHYAKKQDFDMVLDILGNGYVDFDLPNDPNKPFDRMPGEKEIIEVPADYIS